MYFEDFEVGKSYLTPRRTVTQTDIINFACLSGDFNAPHVDMEFCIVEVEVTEETDEYERGPLLITGLSHDATPMTSSKRSVRSSNQCRHPIRPKFAVRGN